MPSAAATKASDKTQACKKLTTLLQKDYGKSVPRLKLPVLETMLFAVCLEDNPWDRAESGYQKLLSSYFDLNEVRVSSVSELERTLSDLNNAEWKGLRIRSILRFVFESTYSFDFEKLSKLTLESAQKRLKKIDYLSPFVTNFTLQQVLGSYVVCLDDYSLRAAMHLGIVPPDSNVEDAGEFLKAGIRKSDTFAFSYLLRCLATDPKFTARLAEPVDADVEFDVLNVAQRLTDLKSPKKKATKPKATKTTAKSTEAVPAKKKTTKPAAKEATKSSSSKSAAASARSASAKKPATATKSPAKKSAPSAAKKKAAKKKK
ncbi:MAG: hypothetical protein R3C59_26845 [Planctomycetaceae bacterium]